MREEIAKAIYADWQKSDRELVTAWEDAPDRLRAVFLNYATIALDTINPTEETDESDAS